MTGNDRVTLIFVTSNVWVTWQMLLLCSTFGTNYCLSLICEMLEGPLQQGHEGFAVLPCKRLQVQPVQHHAHSPQIRSALAVVQQKTVCCFLAQQRSGRTPLTERRVGWAYMLRGAEHARAGML